MLKLKVTLPQATKAQRGVEILLYTSFNIGARRGGQSHAPAALPSGKEPVSIYKRLGGHQGRSVRMRKISPPTGIRSPNRPAHSESLYRLS